MKRTPIDRDALRAELAPEVAKVVARFAHDLKEMRAVLRRGWPIGEKGGLGRWRIVLELAGDALKKPRAPRPRLDTTLRDEVVAFVESKRSLSMRKRLVTPRARYPRNVDGGAYRWRIVRKIVREFFGVPSGVSLVRHDDRQLSLLT